MQCISRYFVGVVTLVPGISFLRRAPELTADGDMVNKKNLIEALKNKELKYNFNKELTQIGTNLDIYCLHKSGECLYFQEVYFFEGCGYSKQNYKEN